MNWRHVFALSVGIIVGTSVAFLSQDSTHLFTFHPQLLLADAESAFSEEEDYNVDDLHPEVPAHDDSPTEPEVTVIHPSATSSPRLVKVPVVIYHSVRPHIAGESKTQEAYDITPELLELQLRYIKEHGYHTVTFAEVLSYFSYGTPLPEKPVILSFDDGWHNQYEYAFPLLRKYDMEGTFFIYTNPIDHKKAHWMSWKEVKELDAVGMEIAGHSRTHPVLTRIATDEALDAEIAGGKKIIEEELGHPISVFAYPFGMKDERTVGAVRRAGYTLARTIGPGVWGDADHAFAFHGALVSDRLEDFVALLTSD